MKTVTIIGRLVSPTEFEVFGHPIRVARAPAKHVGKQLVLEGILCFNNTKGAYLQTVRYELTNLRDSNRVTVSGRVLGILETKDHARHGKTACVILKQSRSKSSKLLVTVPGKAIEELGVSDLSTGQPITITGYLGYHQKGLHVFYLRREKE